MTICVTQFAKTQQNSAFWKFSLLYHYILGTKKLSFAAILSLYCKLQALKARDAIHGFVYIPMAIKITHIKTHGSESHGQAK